MKPLKKNTASTTVCCLVLMLNACSGGSGEGLDKSGQATSTGDQGADIGANTDTGGDLFTRIQNDILTPDCATSGCHTGTTSPLGLSRPGIRFAGQQRQRAGQRSDASGTEQRRC